MSGQAQAVAQQATTRTDAAKGGKKRRNRAFRGSRALQEGPPGVVDTGDTEAAEAERFKVASALYFFENGYVY